MAPASCSGVNGRRASNASAEPINPRLGDLPLKFQGVDRPR